MIIRVILRAFFVVIGLYVALASCSRDNSLVNVYIDLPLEGWSQDSIIEIEVLIEDTSMAYRGVTGIRHNHNYPFRNLYLFREVESERGMEYRDTVMFVLSDAKGVRQGKGLGHTREITTPFGRAPFKFGERGYYTFRITQGMRPESIQGIEAVYFRLLPVEQ